MNGDETFVFRNEGDEDLRQILKEWRVPDVPRDIEEELRRTFRRRLRARVVLSWLITAAALAMFVGAPLYRPRLPLAQPPTSAPVAAPLLEPAPPVVAAPAPVEAPPRIPVARAEPRPMRTRPQPEVIVEPDQGRLIAQLSRALNRATWTPGRITTTVPRSESASSEVPAVEFDAVTTAPVSMSAVEIGSVEWPENAVELDAVSFSLQ
jgi:hypothetical protein